MASDINTGKAPCSNTAAAIDCLSPLVAIRLCDSLETAQPMLNTTLAIHLTSKKVDAFASVTHRLIQGYRFRVGPYRFCGASNPTTHSILLWSYLILSDAHIYIMTIHRQCIFTIYCRICMIARTFEFVHLIFQVRMINHVQCSGFYPSFN